MKQKTAILLGATGLTGRLLLKKLLDSEDYATVKVFARRSTGIHHPKLQEFLGGLTQLDTFKSDFTGDEVFCCIGTTKAKTPNQSEYHAIDVGIPSTAAQLAELNHIDCFAVISAMGANANSYFTYNRFKGEMEQAVAKAHIPYLYILRPSLIIGKRPEKRIAEDWSNWLLSYLQPLMVGALKKYRPITAESIASTLFTLAQTRPKSGVLTSEDIKHFTK